MPQFRSTTSQQQKAPEKVTKVCMCPNPFVKYVNDITVRNKCKTSVLNS